MNLAFLDKLSVLVLGDVMLDKYIWGSVKRISPEAPVPVIDVVKETATAGGAANVAFNLSSLGVKVDIVGVIGDDYAGEEALHLLKENRVGVAKMIVRPGLKTLTKCRVIGNRQQVCRIDWESDYNDYEMVPEELAKLSENSNKYNVVIVSDYAKGAINQNVIDRVRAISRDKKWFSAIDPKPKRALDISGFNLLKPNRNEAYELAGIQAEKNKSSVSDKLLQIIINKYSPDYLVVTLSDDGMVLYNKNYTSKMFPTEAKEIADVSGAGDTVIAVLTAALAAGIGASDACNIANVAAGIVVAKLGTATLTRTELAAKLDAGYGYQHKTNVC
jgi:rfaE bifunctional protein kinase chain/domain